MEKLIIAGSGPAGLTAAIYSARAELQPLVIEGLAPGGQLTVSHQVDNYPGFPDGISGAELMNHFRNLADCFGTRFMPGTVRQAYKEGNKIFIKTEDETLQTDTLIIATGAEARRLPIPSEKKFYGKGVSGCATCDGAFFRGLKVLVIGGGNTAMGDATFLSKFAAEVTVVHRRDYFRAAPVELENARKNEKIKWMIPWTVEDILGNDLVTGAILKNTETGEMKEVQCDGIFVAIGHDPATAAFRELVETDENGFIKIGPNSTATSSPGIFACGDVHDPIYKQAVLAAGHGCMAALDAGRYLENLSS